LATRTPSPVIRVERRPPTDSTRLKEDPAMTRLSRRSFLAVSAAAGAAGHRLLDPAQAGQQIPGFDQTKTDYDRMRTWRPFSDRKVRVGLVGHGVCQFGLAFDLQTHPNVELVAVSDLFPDRCADMARKGTAQIPAFLCSKTLCYHQAASPSCFLKTSCAAVRVSTKTTVILVTV
jgi:hypothetical protein